MLAVYVPTNHLYLGDIVICERDRATFPDISVEEGIRIFLTGGMALPAKVAKMREDAGARGLPGIIRSFVPQRPGLGVRFEPFVCITRDRPACAGLCEVR